MIKRKMVCVQPKTSIANIRFELDMDKLHSCYVDNDCNDMLSLTSINKKYKFMMHKIEDNHWNIIK
jgi:hypothetical protein